MNTFTRFILAVFFTAASGAMYAQNIHRCATTEHHLDQLKNPQYAKGFAKAEQMMNNKLAQNPNLKTTGVITIPVIVHILYANATQNISDAKVIEQINVLNLDFSGTNANVGNTPAVWTSLVANTGIQFCLATQDPSGNPTNGIIHKSTTVGSFSTNDNIKHNNTGGDDAWPASSYLNLWIGNLSGGLLGYAQFPGGPAANDGVVVLYNSVGGPANPGTGFPYHLGRTATHEVGHWVNLRHINGDSNCGSDLVADTPTQDQLHFGCPTHPYHVNVCSGSTNGEMFMNYMDYTDDACMTMFTNGQGARITACMSTTRASLATSIGCTPITAFSNDAGISAIISPAGTICASSIIPEVTLRNFGVNNLTSVTVNYQVDAGTVNTYAWSGTLTPASTVNVTLPAVTVSGAPHTFTSYTSNPNGAADPNAGNDSQTGNFSSSASGLAIPVQEGFQSATYPPTGWTLYNPDNDSTWQHSTTTGQASSSSIFIYNYDYNAWGEYDEMISPAMDLTTGINPQLTFYVAYQLYTDPASNPNFSDTLEVVISTDCGLTWTSIYKKFGIPLTTTTPTFSTVAFVPTASQWRLETVSLAPYAASSNAILKFRNINQYENTLWLDNINIINPTGAIEINTDPTFSVYPIPSKGMIHLQWGAVSNENITVTITNAIGESVYNSEISKYNGTVIPVDLGKQANGVYLIKIQAADKTINQKIVLNK
jgi:pregnancy-associated plasma protein-A/type IX secretion system substrate protein